MNILIKITFFTFFIWTKSISAAKELFTAVQYTARKSCKLENCVSNFDALSKTDMITVLKGS